MARAFPILDENGGIRRWFGTHTEIEDWKDAERALCDQNTKRVASAKLSALEEMAGGIAQVLLNLLNNGFGALEGSQERWVRISLDPCSEHTRFAVSLPEKHEST